MPEGRDVSPAAGPRESHFVGRIDGSKDPTVVVMTGLHGNEPAGLVAARRVLDRLERSPGLVRGRLVVLAGNLRAIRQRARYVDRDLNRVWVEERIAALDANNLPDDAEATEQTELLAALRKELDAATGPVYFLDLHTTSAEGPPFVTVGDTLRNRSFAMNLELPIILGLEEQVDGALLEYLNNRGVTTIGIEAGQHDHPESPDRHEAVLWLALRAAELVGPDAVPDIEARRSLLRRARSGAPHVVEVRQRHPIADRDRFRMNPGFVNFDPVRRGQRLAIDRSGPVLAAEDGLVVLPLYQGKGEDGFFVAREVSRVWLRVSAGLRRLRLGGAIGWLPGVRRRRGFPEQLIVDTRIARFYPLEVFHLFGFRKVRKSGRNLVVSRRRYDLAPPERIRLDSVDGPGVA